MPLPIPITYAPMESRTADALPSGDGWQYEPKWDGFRCLLFRDGDDVHLQSKSGKPLERYFPDLAAMAMQVKPKRFVLDGEIMVVADGRPDFDQLLLRIHPAASRVTALASSHPASLVAFDLLVGERGALLADLPLGERRPKLEAFAERHLSSGRWMISPATDRRDEAQRWFETLGEGLDGVMAKRLDRPYDSGGRDAMIKVKVQRTADCVVGGFRWSSAGKTIGSLLLGLYDDERLLHHVGFTSSLSATQRKDLAGELEKLRRRGGDPSGFTGRAPGGPSRWSTERSTQWEPLPHELVVEVAYDHTTGQRFRHGTKLLRWRSDKPPRQCTMEQIEPSGPSSLELVR